MTTKTYKGTPYHLWNPFTDMDQLLSTLDVGPIVITRGEGPFLFNDRGQRFISGISSLWNVAVGLGREELIEAATRQMRELAFANCFRQSHPRAIELAARLVEITGHRYDRVYLGTNGSEAVETALKMARQYFRQSHKPSDRGRFKIISLRGAYHGVSFGAVSTSGVERDAEKFGPLVPGFLHIEPPYCYRCPFGKTAYPECGLQCSEALDSAIEHEGSETVAAFILEPIMGAFGCVIPPDEYYTRVGEICREHGVLLIVDEVTTGFGRTGRLFASEAWDPQPDILCLGKAISSGYVPLSATLATGEIYEAFRGEGNRFDHGSTASGHPVAAAVGLANIDIIIGENLPENAARMGQRLLDELRQLTASNALVGDVRGRGLMIGIELVKDRASKMPLSETNTMLRMMDIATLGLVPHIMRNIIGLMPPLIIDEPLVEEIATITAKGLSSGFNAGLGRTARLARELAVAKLAR